MKRHLCATIIVLSFALLLIAPVSAANFTPDITDEDVHYNITTHFDPRTTTPFDIWILGAILGLLLFFWTLIGSPVTTSDLERDAVISVLAWVPIGFTALTSFAVDRITSSGVVATTTSGIVLLENHVIYHFDILGYLFGILVLVAIINTFRILALHKSLKLQSDQQTSYSGG
jgi:hypothetical protein